MTNIICLCIAYLLLIFIYVNYFSITSKIKKINAINNQIIEKLKKSVSVLIQNVNDPYMAEIHSYSYMHVIIDFIHNVHKYSIDIESIFYNVYGDNWRNSSDTVGKRKINIDNFETTEVTHNVLYDIHYIYNNYKI